MPPIAINHVARMDIQDRIKVVTNIPLTLSRHNRSFDSFMQTAGESCLSAVARITVRLIAMKIAAGIPLSDTSAIVNPDDYRPPRRNHRNHPPRLSLRSWSHRDRIAYIAGTEGTASARSIAVSHVPRSSRIVSPLADDVPFGPP